MVRITYRITPDRNESFIQFVYFQYPKIEYYNYQVFNWLINDQVGLKLLK